MPSSPSDQILAAAQAIDAVLAPLTADPAAAASVMTACAARAAKRAGKTHGHWLSEVRHLAATAWDGGRPSPYHRRAFEQAEQDASGNGYFAQTVERLRTLTQRREQQVQALQQDISHLRRQLARLQQPESAG